MSVFSTGQQGNRQSFDPAISGDGRYVAFTSYDLMEDVFVRDQKRRTTRRVDVSSTREPGDSDSAGPAISADGRYVAFVSGALNLVAGDTKGEDDVFVRGPLP
jgi:Tol biopolymer transport system component